MHVRTPSQRLGIINEKNIMVEKICSTYRECKSALFLQTWVYKLTPGTCEALGLISTSILMIKS